MKIRILLSVILLCIITGFINTVAAQKNLKALIQKCEAMEGVSIDIVHQKNRETRETTNMVKSISFSNNKTLVDEFLKAFEMDKEDAFQVIQNKQNGKVMPSYYQFAEDDFDVAYTLNVSKDGTGASISVIHNRVKKKKQNN